MVSLASVIDPTPATTRAHGFTYVGIDVAKKAHVAGFISDTLLHKHARFEACPSFSFDNGRSGFQSLVERIQTYAPLDRCAVIMEKTGHYHKPLQAYLIDRGVAVYTIHIQDRPRHLIKSDKRDALGLANQLYNQIGKGMQVGDKKKMVRRFVPPWDSAVRLKNLVQHQRELAREDTRRRNKLTALADQIFPEITQVCKDPNAVSILSLRDAFPTAEAFATAPAEAIRAARRGTFPSNANILRLQDLATTSIGLTEPRHVQSLVLEQKQLIAELMLIRAHQAFLSDIIKGITLVSREGKIVASVPGMGPVQAGGIIAAIGHIDNFPTAGALKSYLGWAPIEQQTGKTMDSASLTRGGSRATKGIMYMVVAKAIQEGTEYKIIYDRLVPRMCPYDERTKAYKGKKKVMGRIAGQMISLMYALLKTDAEVLAQTPADEEAPPPRLYDRDIHRACRLGNYRPTRRRLGRMRALPPIQTTAQGEDDISSLWHDEGSSDRRPPIDN